MLVREPFLQLELSTKLRLTTQRLLRDKRVWTNRTGVDLVIDKVVQLQHVDIADSDRTVEDLTGAAIRKPFLTCLFSILLASNMA